VERKTYGSCFDVSLTLSCSDVRCPSIHYRKATREYLLTFSGTRYSNQRYHLASYSRIITPESARIFQEANIGRRPNHMAIWRISDPTPSGKSDLDNRADFRIHFTQLKPLLRGIRSFTILRRPGQQLQDLTLSIYSKTSYWNSIMSVSISVCVKPVDVQNERYFAHQGPLGVAVVRLIPKPNGFRPIVNLGRTIVCPCPLADLMDSEVRMNWEYQPLGGDHSLRIKSWGPFIRFWLLRRYAYVNRIGW